MNVNPYAANLEDNPFAEMAALRPEAEDRAERPPTIREELFTDKYYERQIEAVRVMLKGYEAPIKEMVAQVSALKITNTDDEQAAMALALPLDRLFKQIENARLSYVEAPNKYIKAVNSLARHYQGLIDAGLKASRAELNNYARLKQIEAQRKALEEQKVRDAARKAAEAEAAKLKAEAEAAGLKAPEIEIPAPAEEPAPPTVEKTVRSAEGKVTTVKNWKFRVESPDKVPREYLAVDEKKIRAAVKDGVRHIDGVTIYEDSDIRFSS